MGPRIAAYRGEFRYVFYAPTPKYEATVDFYSRLLEFPVVGGFGDASSPGQGVYLKASVGVLEVIRSEGSDLRDMLLERGQEFRPPTGGFLMIEVNDVDALHRRVAERGAEILQPPRDWPWKFRDFKTADPCGNILCLFSRLPGWESHHLE